MKRAKRSVRPKVQVGGPYSFASCRCSWAGYEVDSGSNGGNTFDPSSATWVEPSFNEAYYSGIPAFWAGIGGGSNAGNYVVQAGASSAANRDGGAQPYMFFVEDGGYDFLRWIKDVALYGGDTAYSQVTYEGSTSWAYVENETTGVHTSLYFETPDFNGHSAEWIYEAVDTTAGYRAGISTHFSSAQLTTMAGGGGLFWTYNTTKDIMNSNGKCSGGTVEGQPGPINENTSGFPVSS